MKNGRLVENERIVFVTLRHVCVGGGSYYSRTREPFGIVGPVLQVPGYECPRTEGAFGFNSRMTVMFPLIYEQSESKAADIS